MDETNDETTAIKTDDLPLGRILLAVFCTAVADWLFFDHPFGFTVGLFGALLLALVLFSPGRTRGRIEYLLATAAFGLCLRAVYEPGPPVVALFGAILLSLALTRRDGWTADAWTWVRRWANWIAHGLIAATGEVVLVAAGIVASMLSDRARRSLRHWLLPVALGAVFVALFAVANPLVSKALQNAWALIAQHSLPHPSALRIVFWIVSAVAVAALLTYTTRIASSDPAAGSKPGAAWLSPQVIRRALILFNVLFAAQTVLDAMYLWGGARLPADLTYAEYAHRGAYVLVLTALLAGAFALVAFRPGADDAGLRLERGLVYLWLAQNVFLVVSSAWRLGLYVDAYSLTRLRVAAALWMLLVIAGLILVAIRIATRRTGRWLVNANATAVLAVLYGAAMTGVDAHIAWFNVRHCAEIRGDDHPEADVEYLRRLGFDALPALRWLSAQCPDFDNAPAWLEARSDLSRELTATLSDWRGWTWRRASLVAPLNPVDEEDAFSYGSVVRVSGNSVVVSEYDFESNKMMEMTYATGPETVFDDDSDLSQLKAGDDVLLEYSSTNGHRFATGLIRERPEAESETPAPPVVEAPPPPRPQLRYPVLYPPRPIAIGTVTSTGRVVALRPGKIVLRVPGDPPGSTTNRDFAITVRAELRGLTSLSDLQVDQRVVFRHAVRDGRPAIVELAARGAVLTGKP